MIYDILHNHWNIVTININKISQLHFLLQVRRISVSTSTDEITGKPKLWLLMRECADACEPGCIAIGERTKLHSCITCCDESNYCNYGSGAAKHRFILKFPLSFVLFSIVQGPLKQFLVF